jgi:hypothetical protein
MLNICDYPVLKIKIGNFEIGIMKENKKAAAINN